LYLAGADFHIGAQQVEYNGINNLVVCGGCGWFELLVLVE